MSIGVFTLALMLALAYAFLHEGVATSFCMFCNVVLAGFIAFNFWEPLADLLEETMTGTFLQGYEDFICLGVLFALSLGLLRFVSNHLLPTQAGLHPQLQGFGSLALGLLAGYLLAGFLLSTLQTLPWHERFMQFDPQIDLNGPTQKVRRWLPPDRIWLAMMQRASEGGLCRNPHVLFDPNGTFEQRYARYRRYNDLRDPLPFTGEIEP